MVDKIVIGAGLYGLYAALFSAKQGQSVLLLEKDPQAMSRATYVNQARVHMGYHYPRSLSTACKTKAYFDRFNSDYGFCIHDQFEQVYATSANFSYTNAAQFQKFCQAADIRCDNADPEKYFQKGMCDGAFLTTEYTYDAAILRQWFLAELEKYPQVRLAYNADITAIEKEDTCYTVHYNGTAEQAPFVLNATYAGTNQIQRLIGAEPFGIKYELCEIILCSVSDKLKDTGITVMDGPFFSIMPFGKTGLHSLTSVTFTPHMTSYESLPTFPCQQRSGGTCSPQSLGNCNTCPAKPKSAAPYMLNLAKKYLKPEYGFRYEGSLYSMKPILKASEVDDSRPTVIRVHSQAPTFVSVLSGKISTIYDMDEVLRL